MEQNPLEQQRIKIEETKNEMRRELGRLFDNRGDLEKRIDDFAHKLEVFQKNGLVFDREGILKGLDESKEIKDREEFIVFLSKLLEPLVVSKFTQPGIFEKTQREFIIESGGSIKLSEILYTSLSEMNNQGLAIHLAPAAELIKEKGIGNFKKEIENGLIKLAEIVEEDPKIERIDAVSWIVAKNPSLLKRLGFTIVGEIPQEMKKKNFNDEARPVAAAFMSRDELLARYGKKEHS